MTKPLFVAISDIHFSVQNLELSSIAFSAAINSACLLNVPLIIAGDLNDTKPIIRAEVANRLISLLNEAPVNALIIVGNHDLINEKGKEHSLNFLRPYCRVIDHPYSLHCGGTLVELIPYQSDSKSFLEIVSSLNKGSLVVCHQGFLGANMGDYIQDRTSVDPSVMKDHTVISGHYHRHQTLGTVTYIGNPFTMSFGEANDGPKGFLVVNEDGTFTREILNLRKHVILEHTTESIKLKKSAIFDSQDLVWLKITGPKSELAKVDKKRLAGVKLDLIPIDSEELPRTRLNLPPAELLDSLIDNLQESDYYKKELKSMWRNLLETN